MKETDRKFFAQEPINNRDLYTKLMDLESLIRLAIPPEIRAMHMEAELRMEELLNKED